MKSLFSDIGFVSSGILNVSPREASELSSRGAVIVDVREEYQTNFKNFDVPEIILLPFSRLAKEYMCLPRKRYLILADSVGLKSREAVLFLKDTGFERIANMAGGITDWERDGLALKTNVDERLSGSCICQLKPRERGRHKALKNRIHSRNNSNTKTQ